MRLGLEMREKIWYNIGVMSENTPENDKKRRKSLRNANIDYRRGCFFVTSQVSFGKSLFGSIVGRECALNELGRRVQDCWRALPEKYPGVELDDFVVMPNHFHGIVRIPQRREGLDLGFVMKMFKGGTGYIYGQMRRAGKVDDIGEHLWQLGYWDDLITGEDELAAIRKYIRENPANWTRDRYGVCTSYREGNPELLNRRRVAVVASHGFGRERLKLRKVWAKESREANGSDALQSVVISTFTSEQEREMLRRALGRGRAIIQVVPQGIPERHPPELQAAIEEGRALLISPQPAGSNLNKKVATWCNEYVIRHADEIWAGDIAENGMLRTLLGALKGIAL